MTAANNISLGNIVRFDSKAVTATGGSSIEVITIPSTYRSAKIHASAVDDETGEYLEQKSILSMMEVKF